jgi:MFS family permease
VSDNPNPASAPGASTSPAQQALIAETQAEHTATGAVRTPVKAKYIVLLLVAMFGAYVALVAPIAISLSLRVQELAPKNVEVQGYIIGIAAIVTTITGPLLGLWSDRTRSRFGRRRPFALVGALVGMVGLAGLAAANGIPFLMIAWIITSIGWSLSMNSLLQSQADRLPESQYGKVAGLSGFVQMAAPVFGAGLAASFIGNNYLLFLVPGAVGLITMLCWVIFIPERDTRALELSDRMSVGAVVRSLVFNPATYPDFAWNWLARLLFMMGVTFTTTFTSLFYASRLSANGQVSSIGGVIVILSMVSLVATGGGALVGGFLSDKLRRRRSFVLFAGIVYTIGALILAFGGSNFALLLTGSFVTGLALGVFSAVDQAIVLNVLPEKDTDAGRFLGINGYSTSIAQALAPILAAPLILIGATGDQKNYGVLFIIAAVLTIVAGVLVQWRVRSVR